MKRFFTFSFLLASFVLYGQNLIPDGSVENYVECPSNFGDIETWLPSWKTFRGSPDYFNSCSSGLGWNNDLGYQEPRTGEGYLGLITFETGLGSVREYIGIEFLESLVVGETYYLTFYVSRAYDLNAGNNLASNNIGILFLTENYLNPNEQGPSLNYSNLNEVNIVEDTVNWVEMNYQFIADSAYQYLAIGNFYDDEFTDTLRIGGMPTGSVISYYYFDDFCLRTSSLECDFINTTDNNYEAYIQLFPNPCKTILFIENRKPIDSILIFTMQGELLESYRGNERQSIKLDLSLRSGIYMAIIESDGKKAIKRFVVSN
jgi:hypothetical protein